MKMRLDSTILAGLLAAVAPIISHGANLGTQPVVFESGNWTVRRGSDAMTDKVTCTGIYKNDFGIQLSPGNFYIHVSGGIEQIQLRMDDNPPNPARLPMDVEKRINSIVISGVEFSSLFRANRLRTNILTNVSGVHEDDLDLTGIDEAYNAISNGCPGEPIKVGSHAATPVPVADGCSDRAKVKMKIKGLSETDIKDICSK